MRYDRCVTRTNTSRRRILIVDDDLGIIEVLKDHLEVLYDAAVDGRDALGRVRQTAPDLIVLDMHLAGLTGLEVLTQVHDVNPKIPVVSMCGNEDGEATAAAMAHGAFAYVSKPFDFDYLDDVVARALAS